MIEIELSGPPRGKGRPRSRIINGFVSVYTDAATRAYELKLAWTAKAAMEGKPPFDCPLTVEIIAYIAIPDSWPKKKKLSAESGEIVPGGPLDIDNICKASLDGLNGVVWLDDKQIVGLTAWKIYSSEPRLTIRVEPWGQSNADQARAIGAGK